MFISERRWAPAASKRFTGQQRKESADHDVTSKIFGNRKFSELTHSSRRRLKSLFPWVLTRSIRAGLNYDDAPSTASSRALYWMFPSCSFARLPNDTRVYTGSRLLSIKDCAEQYTRQFCVVLDNRADIPRDTGAVCPADAAHKYVFVGGRICEFRAREVNPLRAALKKGYWADGGGYRFLDVLITSVSCRLDIRANDFR
jgi:hypothetical protein